MVHSYFTSESVAMGHPDKIADQISDSILDACLAQDKESRVACETLVTTGMVVLAGEITTNAQINYQEVVREAIQRIGYSDPATGFDYRSCGILIALNKQSTDICQGVTEGAGLFQEQGAGDQGMMFGFACDETPELMPLPIMLAHHLVNELCAWRTEGVVPYLLPDGKVQVTVEYDDQRQPVRVDTIVISTQHQDHVEHATIVRDMKSLAHKVIPQRLIDERTRFFINPTGRFVIGGPAGDCGLTGRKIIVDTYGGMGRHGGGAFSGKDPSKVDRSAAYAARYVAKHVVAAKLAQRCEVQIAYAIGVAQPVSIKVDTFGTAVVAEEVICRAIARVFDLTPKGIISMLDLKRPIYSQTAFGGHFGRHHPHFSWEKLDRVQQLTKAVKEELPDTEESSFNESLIPTR
jgi:S-adenosylmethionine synthetase